MSRHEPILANSVPVTAGRLYVADGKVIISPVTGLVSDLKTALGVSVIRQIDVPARRWQTSPAGEAVFED